MCNFAALRPGGGGTWGRREGEWADELVVISDAVWLDRGITQTVYHWEWYKDWMPNHKRVIIYDQWRQVVHPEVSPATLMTPRYKYIWRWMKLCLNRETGAASVGIIYYSFIQIQLTARRINQDTNKHSKPESGTDVFLAPKMDCHPQCAI